MSLQKGERRRLQTCSEKAHNGNDHKKQKIMISINIALSLLALATTRQLQDVTAHATMSYPPNRFNFTMDKAGQCTFPKGSPFDYTADTEKYGSCLWFNEGCQIGCASCTGTFPGGVHCSIPNADGSYPNCNDGTKAFCDTPMEPTITDPELLTYKTLTYPAMKYNPWRAPGFAPMVDSCGLAGGWVTSMGWVGEAQGGTPPPGHEYGERGSELPESEETEWIAGETAEVAWSFWANHGGGYQYRLCKKDSEFGLTEKCFQATPLTPVGSTSYIQYGSDKSTRKPIKAVRVSQGVNPAGSVWTKNPIPYANGNLDIPVGQTRESLGEAFFEPQFTPPLDGVDGGGIGVVCGNITQFQEPGFLPKSPYGECTKEEFDAAVRKYAMNVVDEVYVPVDIEPGKYVLGFRWDCEGSPQIWSGCSDIIITSKSDKSNRNLRG